MKIIPILVTTDNNFMPRYELVISSICHNLDKDYNIKVYCIYKNDTTKENIDNFVKLKKIYNNIEDIVMVNYQERFPDVTWPNVSNTALSSWSDVIYYSLAAEYIIEEDKYIFIDGDIVNNNSIHTMFETDLKDNFVAGTVELISVPKRQKKLEYVYKDYFKSNDFNHNHYFNKGCIVINNKLCKQEHVHDKLRDILFKYIDYLEFPEQDAMNLLFHHKTVFLSTRYNFFNIYCRRAHLKCKQANIISQEYENDFSDVLKYRKDKVVNYHFAGKNQKPWKTYDNPSMPCYKDVYFYHLDLYNKEKEI